MTPRLATQPTDTLDGEFEKDIREFKLALCNESDLIVDTLRHDFTDFVLDTILDVGAGFQALSVRAFPKHDITLLDKIEYRSPDLYEKRVTSDFFDYLPPPHDTPRTLLFCHVLQYLDDDLEKLYRKIRSLEPSRIIAVVNDNDGSFGNAVRWARLHIPMSNPEIDIPMSPIGFRLTKRSQITATFVCPDYETLAYQFGRLILDLPSDFSRSPVLRAHLESLLEKPVLTINQSILGYER